MRVEVDEEEGARGIRPLQYSDGSQGLMLRLNYISAMLQVGWRRSVCIVTHRPVV